MAAMSIEIPKSVDRQDHLQVVEKTNLLDRVIPPSLQQAEALTCRIIGDIIENEAPPPVGVRISLPKVPEHVFDINDEGITTSIFHLEKAREDGTPESIPHTVLDVSLVHNKKNPDFVELNTNVRIEQTENYSLGPHTTEISTIIITTPVHLPDEGSMPNFNMKTVHSSDDAKQEFREKLAQDINEAYIYMEDEVKFIEGKRKIRFQGKPIKSSAA